MPENSQASEGGRSLSWLEYRLPCVLAIKRGLMNYEVPKNLNGWYVFGALALLVFALQILTGMVLLMHYKPDASKAFQSLEFLMREVQQGWLIRYMHTTGASMFFVVVYAHIIRGFLYGSYRKPRELVWLLGMVLLICLMAEAFTGYLLPWGQMSYWAAQVITQILVVIPWVGADLALWVRGDFLVSDATLGRFFALHVFVVPSLFVAFVWLHIHALHAVGASNPSGRLQPLMPFFPYFFVRDLFAAVLFLLVFFAIVFFVPEMGGFFLEYTNYIPANPLQTPEHIAPMWYFAPFYAILRASTWNAFGVDAKVWGAMLTIASLGVFAGLPWLDKSPIYPLRFRPWWHQMFFAVLFSAFIGLGVLGLLPLTDTRVVMAQGCTIAYFVFFITLPWWSRCGHFEGQGS